MFWSWSAMVSLKNGNFEDFWSSGGDQLCCHPPKGCICSFSLISEQYLLSLCAKILRGVVKVCKQNPTCLFHTSVDWYSCAQTEREQKSQNGRFSFERLSCQHTSTRDGGEACKERRWWSLHQKIKKDAKKCIPGSSCQKINICSCSPYW